MGLPVTEPHPHGVYLELLPADAGVAGIPAAERPLMFERFPIPPCRTFWYVLFIRRIGFSP